MSELQAHFNDLKLDKTIFVIVIKGAGPGFSAGHDLKEMQNNRDELFFS